MSAFEGFKKVGSTKTHTIMEHPDGHVIHIKHDALDTKAKNELRKIPTQKLADGGQVADKQPKPPQQPQAASAANQQPNQKISINQDKAKKVSAGFQSALGFADGGEIPEQPALDANGYAPISSGVLGKVGSWIGDQIADLPRAMADTAAVTLPKGYNYLAEDKSDAPVADAQAAPVAESQLAPEPPKPMEQGAPMQAQSDALQAGNKMFQSGMANQVAGIKGEADAQAKLGHEQAAAYDQHIADQKQGLADFQQAFQKIQGHRAQLMQSIENGEIDPNHYINNMSTGAAIMSTIGMILGGLGSGGDPRNNPALNYLNDQINRDIEAQKFNLGKNKTLLEATQQDFGNTKDAAEMAKIYHNDIISAQINKMAASSQDPLVKARAQQAIGALQSNNAEKAQQMGLQTAVMGSIGRGTVDPATVIQTLVPPARQGETMKELKDAQTMTQHRDNMMSAFDKLSKINTVGNQITSPIQSIKEVNAIREPLLAQMVKDDAGRITPTDVEMFRKLFPAMGDSPKILATKRQQMLNAMQQKMAFPSLKPLGLEPKPLKPANTKLAPIPGLK